MYADDVADGTVLNDTDTRDAGICAPLCLFRQGKPGWDALPTGLATANQPASLPGLAP